MTSLGLVTFINISLSILAKELSVTQPEIKYDTDWLKSEAYPGEGQSGMSPLWNPKYATDWNV